MIKRVKEILKKNGMLRNSLILVLGLGIITLFVLAVQKKMETGVKEFRVSIKYTDNTKKLINGEYIKEALRAELGYDIERIRIEDLDLKTIESLLNQNSFVDNVQVYIDARNVIKANIIQKNPLVRINRDNDHFYLDDSGRRIPLSPVASVRVPVITGKIVQYDDLYQLEDEHQYKDIFKLSKAISEDEFLVSLIEQIHIENNNNYLLIPKIGKEKIIIGDVYELDEKIFRLKEFYKEGLTRVGWGKYAYLDLRYNGLVNAIKK